MQNGIRTQFSGMQDFVSGSYELFDGETLKVEIRARIEDYLKGQGGSVDIPYWAAIGEAQVTVSSRTLTITRGKKESVYRRAD